MDAPYEKNEKSRLIDTPKGVLSFAKYSRRTIQKIKQIPLLNPRLIDILHPLRVSHFLIINYKPRLIDKPLSVTRRVCRSTTPGMTVISLGRTLPSDSCSLPETHKKTSRFPPPEGEIGLCLALLQPGVAWPLHYCRRRWSLTPPFHPYHFWRTVSVARSGRFPRPGDYPAVCSMESGLSSKPEGSATI